MGFTWNKMCSLFVSKTKNGEKLKKIIYYFLGQNRVSYFWKIKYWENSNFEFSFWQLLVYCII